jgi:uncharacterized protein YneF (UPF0154 family)
MPTSEHIIFIPAILLIGIVLGFILGSRAAREEMTKKRKRARE